MSRLQASSLASELPLPTSGHISSRQRKRHRRRALLCQAAGAHSPLTTGATATSPTATSGSVSLTNGNATVRKSTPGKNPIPNCATTENTPQRNCDSGAPKSHPSTNCTRRKRSRQEAFGDSPATAAAWTNHQDSSTAHLASTAMDQHNADKDTTAAAAVNNSFVSPAVGQHVDSSTGSPTCTPHLAATNGTAAAESSTRPGQLLPHATPQSQWLTALPHLHQSRLSPLQVQLFLSNPERYTQEGNAASPDLTCLHRQHSSPLMRSNNNSNKENECLGGPGDSGMGHHCKLASHGKLSSTLPTTAGASSKQQPLSHRLTTQESVFTSHSNTPFQRKQHTTTPLIHVIHDSSSDEDDDDVQIISSNDALCIRERCSRSEAPLPPSHSDQKPEENQHTLPAVPTSPPAPSSPPSPLLLPPPPAPAKNHPQSPPPHTKTPSSMRASPHSSHSDSHFDYFQEYQNLEDLMNHSNSSPFSPKTHTTPAPTPFKNQVNTNHHSPQSPVKHITLSPTLPTNSAHHNHVAPHLTPFELLFPHFFIRFFSQQQDHMEICLLESFYFQQEQYVSASLLEAMDETTLDTTRHSFYHKNHPYSINLNHPTIMPNDFLRLFTKLKQMQQSACSSGSSSVGQDSDSTTSLVHYFQLFQPQSSIIFQSPIQINNFIKNIVEIIPELSEKQQELLSDFTLYDTDEVYDEDENVHLFHICVRNLFEKSVHEQQADVFYHGEFYNPLESNEWPSENETVFNTNGEDCTELLLALLKDQSTTRSSIDPSSIPHIPHGYGRRKSPSEEYTGYWRFGKQHGEGHLIANNGQLEYFGDFYHGHFDGRGSWKHRINEEKTYLYNGEFKTGKKSGYGIMKLLFSAVQQEEQQPLEQTQITRERWSQLFGTDSDEDEEVERHASWRTSSRSKQKKSSVVSQKSAARESSTSVTCKEWYRGNWENDYIQGFGEMRSAASWKMGDWLRSKLVQGCGMLLNRETEFFERLTQPGIGQEQIVRPLVPRGYFESLLRPQLTANTKQAQRVLYKGYCFRSRLETRWALFFEFLGIDYLYECKKFRLPDGREYTPDFYIPKMHLWIEIKPLYPTEEERGKAQLLSEVLAGMQNDAQQAPWRVLLIHGDCEAPFLKKHHPGAMMIEFFANREPEEPCIWVQCRQCHRMDAVRRGQHVKCGCNGTRGSDPIRPALQLQMAYEHAHKFDFEEYNAHLQSFYAGTDFASQALDTEE